MVAQTPLASDCRRHGICGQQANKAADEPQSTPRHAKRQREALSYARPMVTFSGTRRHIVKCVSSRCCFSTIGRDHTEARQALQEHQHRAH